MSDYHHVYETAEKDDTEWDAIQRRLGNLPAKPKKKPPPKFKPAQEKQRDAAFLQKQGEHELDDLEDDFEDDRFLEAYRQKRLEEMRQQNQQKIEFGSVMEICGGEFIQQVTEASENCWVVVLMYQPRHLKCEELEKCLDEIAADYPCTKFVKIFSDACIQGYPRENLPTLLIYRDRACKRNLIGLGVYREGRVSAENVVETLNRIGPICQ